MNEYIVMFKLDPNEIMLRTREVEDDEFQIQFSKDRMAQTRQSISKGIFPYMGFFSDENEAKMHILNYLKNEMEKCRKTEDLIHNLVITYRK